MEPIKNQLPYIGRRAPISTIKCLKEELFLPIESKRTKTTKCNRSQDSKLFACETEGCDFCGDMLRATGGGRPFYKDACSTPRDYCSPKNANIDGMRHSARIGSRFGLNSPDMVGSITAIEIQPQYVKRKRGSRSKRLNPKKTETDTAHFIADEDLELKIKEKDADETRNEHNLNRGNEKNGLISSQPTRLRRRKKLSPISPHSCIFCSHLLKIQHREPIAADDSCASPKFFGSPANDTSTRRRSARIDSLFGISSSEGLGSICPPELRTTFEKRARSFSHTTKQKVLTDSKINLVPSLEPISFSSFEIKEDGLKEVECSNEQCEKERESLRKENDSSEFSDYKKVEKKRVRRGIPVVGGYACEYCYSLLKVQHRTGGYDKYVCGSPRNFGSPDKSVPKKQSLRHSARLGKKFGMYHGDLLGSVKDACIDPIYFPRRTPRKNVETKYDEEINEQQYKTSLAEEHVHATLNRQKINNALNFDPDFATHESLARILATPSQFSKRQLKRKKSCEVLSCMFCSNVLSHQRVLPFGAKDSCGSPRDYGTPKNDMSLLRRRSARVDNKFGLPLSHELGSIIPVKFGNDKKENLLDENLHDGDNVDNQFFYDEAPKLKKERAHAFKVEGGYACEICFGLLRRQKREGSNDNDACGSPRHYGEPVPVSSGKSPLRQSARLGHRFGTISAGIYGSIKSFESDLSSWCKKLNE